MSFYQSAEKVVNEDLKAQNMKLYESRRRRSKVRNEDAHREGMQDGRQTEVKRRRIEDPGLQIRCCCLQSKICSMTKIFHLTKAFIPQISPKYLPHLSRIELSPCCSAVPSFKTRCPRPRLQTLQPQIQNSVSTIPAAVASAAVAAVVASFMMTARSRGGNRSNIDQKGCQALCHYCR